jgi:hypothetical protein
MYLYEQARDIVLDYLPSPFASRLPSWVDGKPHQAARCVAGFNRSNAGQT